MCYIRHLVFWGNKISEATVGWTCG